MTKTATPEMKLAAVKAYCAVHGTCRTIAMHAALEAALAASPPPAVEPVVVPAAALRKDGFAAGFEAQQAGEDEDANPYPEGSSRWCDWSDGWESANEEEREPALAVGDGWLIGDALTPEQAWTILCETPDITSPEEFPDHALITLEQLSGFMERATPSTDLREENERLKAENDEAKREARILAQAMWEQSYSDVTGWKMLDDTAGIITQISNMAAGIRDRVATISAENAALAERLERVEGLVQRAKAVLPQFYEDWHECVAAALAREGK